MQRLKLTSENQNSVIAEAVACLQRGELILFPTETVYGLGADATNPDAITKLMQYKTQRNNKPLSVLVSGPEMAAQFVTINHTAEQAYASLLPGPITVVSQGKHLLPPGVESPEGNLGIRWSSHPVAQALSQAFGKPITATSANSSGQKRPYQIEDILTNTSPKQQALISLAIDAGTLPPNPPSTVIDTTLETLQVLRQGTFQPHAQETRTFPNESETISYGHSLAQRFRSHYGYQPVIFALSGPMGAGKTHLTKGLAQGLGIHESITSPSFTLLHEYEFVSEGKSLPLWHIDAWRMESSSELEQLGISTLIDHNGVLVLEWANLSQANLERWPHAKIIQVELSYTPNENERTATLHLPPND